MADWKQITARIRRARSSKDPAGQLTNLFSKTRDAMVAYELARFFESSGNPTDAGKWYLTAAQRFRRADWKTKAQECASRLGATTLADAPAVPVIEPTASSLEPSAVAGQETAVSETSVGAGELHEIESPVTSAKSPAAIEVRPVAQGTAPNRTTEVKHTRTRRGHKGRERHRPSRRTDHLSTSQPSSSAPAESAASVSNEPSSVAVPAPSVPAGVESPAPTLRGRFGDPGLSSRLSQLEMNFRRLLSCAPQKLEEASHAPAGPGVWLLTDSDLTSYFYVESCQTLRVAIPNLLRGSSARHGESLKPRLADHLGIPESKVGKYLSEHCVVRWLQMDDDASHFAHFLVAVLRPALNE